MFMQRALYRMLVLFIASALFTTSCRKDSDNPVDGGKNQSTITTTIIGVVSDESGQGLGGVTVNSHGKNATTNENGLFVIKDARVPQDRCFVIATSDGYFTNSRAEKPAEGGITNMRLSLMRNTAHYSVSSLTGGVVHLGEGGSVDLPADGYVTATGQEYNGTVKVAARWLNPTTSKFFSLFPGDFAATRTDGSETQLYSYGVLNVELMSQTGEKLQLGADKRAVLKYPIPSEMLAQAPSEMPLWYFDETIGMWKEDGRAVRQGAFYVGEVSHFTPWNCDVPVEFGFIEGRVLCNGGPVSGVVIRIGQREVISDENGFYQCGLPAGIEFQINVEAAQNMGLHTDAPINVTVQARQTTTVDIPVGPCPSYITGTLVDCNGQPTEGIIQVRGTMNYGYVAVKNGYFKIRVETGVPVSVDALGYNTGVSDIRNVDPVPSCSTFTFGSIGICPQQTIPYTDINPEMKSGGVAALSPDGRLLAVTDYLTIKVLDIHDGTVVSNIPVGKPGCTGLAFSRDGKLLLATASSSYITVNDGSVTVIDTKTWQKIRSFSGTISGVFTHDSRSVLIAENPSKDIVEYSVATGSETRRFNILGPPTMYGPLMIGTRSNGQEFICQTYDYDTYAAHLVVWDMVKNASVTEFAMDLKNYPAYVSLSADGTRMLEETQQGGLNFYNLATASIFNSIAVSTSREAYRSSMINPAGTRYVVQLSQQGVLMPPGIFNVADGSAVHLLPSPGAYMFTKFVFNTNGTMLLGLYDKDKAMGIRVWRLP